MYPSHRAFLVTGLEFALGFLESCGIYVHHCTSSCVGSWVTERAQKGKNTDKIIFRNRRWCISVFVYTRWPQTLCPRRCLWFTAAIVTSGKFTLNISLGAENQSTDFIFHSGRGKCIKTAAMQYHSFVDKEVPE